MSLVKMDHAQVMQLAKKYHNAEDEVAQLLKTLESTQSQLESIWEGQAWNEFDATFNEFRPKIKDFGEFLGSVGKQLDTNAKAVQDLDAELQKANKL